LTFTVFELHLADRMEQSMNRFTALVVLLMVATGTAAAEQSVWQEARVTCKQVASCEEAVLLWCGGYSGADRDRDGIPCENVCRSGDQVDAIRQKIGC
jgi:hypothetical protein